MKLPGVWAATLQKLALHEIKLAFPEATGEQQLVILFLAIMQTLQAGPAASGLRFDLNATGEMQKIRLQEMSDQRSKALEVLANVMETVRDVEKTVLDNLRD